MCTRMTETQIEITQLKCKILSFYVNFEWGRITFDCLTSSHIIFNNEVLEEKKSRVKVTYKYSGLDSLQREVFDKLLLLTKEATFTIDPQSKLPLRKEDGYYYSKYTATSYPSTSKCLAQWGAIRSRVNLSYLTLSAA